MEPTVQVAIIGVATTMITTTGVIIVAFVNNRRERSSAATGGVESTLRERITLKDEQLQDLRDDKARLQARLDVALEALDEKDILVQHLRDELVAKDIEIQRLTRECRDLGHDKEGMGP